MQYPNTEVTARGAEIVWGMQYPNTEVTARGAEIISGMLSPLRDVNYTYLRNAISRFKILVYSLKNCPMRTCPRKRSALSSQLSAVMLKAQERSRSSSAHKLLGASPLRWLSCWAKPFPKGKLFCPMPHAQESGHAES
ncbi:MAG: hypothetical protein F6J93_19490 [Oscillatoria sp. SIO1A7]|nr:hypothetical protein [Oscillatoria sp. SIO1A7]